MSTTHAQTTTATATGSKPYKLVGTNFQTDASGGVTLHSGMVFCPFAVGADFDAAFTAAGNACPYIERNGERRPLTVCREYYRNKSMPANASQGFYKDIRYCHLPAGAARDAAFSIEMMGVDGVAANMGAIAGGVGIKTGSFYSVPTQSAAARKEIDEEDKKKKDEDRACYQDSLDNIGKYFASKRTVDCIVNATRFITGKALGDIRLLGTSYKTSLGVATAAAGPAGPAGITQLIANLASDLGLASADRAQELERLLSGCTNIESRFNELVGFRGDLGEGLCRGVANLVERQLTQCIRVTFTSSLRLPRIAAQLQCPINLNVNAFLGPAGLTVNANCFTNNPLQVSQSGFGRFGSFVGQGGGLDALFRGNCFKQAGTVNAQGQSIPGGGGSSAQTPIPGVDCGALDPTLEQRTQSAAIKGTIPLAAGAMPSDRSGWAKGGTDNGAGVSRCDFYSNGTLARTIYVFGNGSQCNGGDTLSVAANSSEVNTACYPNSGYTPADALNVPSACLVCGSGAKATENGACADNTLPRLTTDPRATYIKKEAISVGAGVGTPGGPVEGKCSEFDGKLNVAVCCDPSKQDCGKRPNDAICQCDDGDGTNWTVLPAGQFYPDGTASKGPFLANGNQAVNADMCFKGGYKTCCSTKLNGDSGCATVKARSNGRIEICPSETQCFPEGTIGQYTGPRGSGQNVTVDDIATFRPSPWLYVHVRPDYEYDRDPRTGRYRQQCCTTAWCNVCPQHYVNAWGLAAMNKPITNPNSDADNNSLVRKGWPYTTEVNSFGVESIIAPIASMELEFNPTGFKESDYREAPINRALFYSSSYKNMPSNAAITQCNTTTGLPLWGADSNAFNNSNNVFGFVYNTMDNKRRKPRYSLVAGVPEPQETPLEYLNRIRQAAADGGTFEPIQLCEDAIQICTGSSGNALDNTDSNRPPRGSNPPSEPNDPDAGYTPGTRGRDDGEGRESVVAPAQVQAPQPPSGPAQVRSLQNEGGPDGGRVQGGFMETMRDLF